MNDSERKERIKNLRDLQNDRKYLNMVQNMGTYPPPYPPWHKKRLSRLRLTRLEDIVLRYFPTWEQSFLGRMGVNKESYRDCTLFEDMMGMSVKDRMDKVSVLDDGNMKIDYEENGKKLALIFVGDKMIHYVLEEFTEDGGSSSGTGRMKLANLPEQIAELLGN